MAKVLTESEVAAIGGTSTSYGNRCCTKARAEELGCTVTEPSGAVSNLLITGVESAHDYVDLGLPSGTKWATMNVGANSVTDKGFYFQWGDTQGYTADQVGTGTGKKYFGWEDYKYGNGTSSPGTTDMIKYNSTDGKTVLEASDDAARANWGGQWRMPTETQVQELIDNTEKRFIGRTVGSTTVYGYEFAKSGDTDFNGDTLFFPYSDLANKGRVVKNSGCYWSSSLYSSDVKRGCFLEFSNTRKPRVYNRSRNFGHVVRGVIG